MENLVSSFDVSDNTRPRAIKSLDECKKRDQAKVDAGTHKWKALHDSHNTVVLRKV